jgi:hypothetical protein
MSNRGHALTIDQGWEEVARPCRRQIHRSGALHWPISTEAAASLEEIVGIWHRAAEPSEDAQIRTAEPVVANEKPS